MMLRSSPKIKSKTLEWLGNCLQHNLPRGKLWSTHAPELNPDIYTNVTDGFMINMCNLMMRLCQPFCCRIRDEKVLKVDPTYWAVPVSILLNYIFGLFIHFTVVFFRMKELRRKMFI